MDQINISDDEREESRRIMIRMAADPCHYCDKIWNEDRKRPCDSFLSGGGCAIRRELKRIVQKFIREEEKHEQ